MSSSLPDLEFAEAQIKITQRFASRRYNIFLMRAQIRRVVLLMALMEVLRVGVPQLVFAGKKDQYPAPGEDDFGIAYWVGYFISYIYLCVFMVVWTPLFSWWVPKDIPSDSSTGKVLNKTVVVIKAFDMAILPFGIVLSLAQYVYYMLLNLVHPDSSGPLFRKPANDHTAWAARILMFCGVKLALVFGYAAFEILEQSGLARVKTVEYMIIVVPIQINIGMILGGVMQWKMEQRILKKQFARKNTAAKMEEGTKGEKEGLLVET